jgi:CBS domain-containing protein
MKSIKAGDLMQPLSECVTVSQDDTLYAAVVALDEMDRKKDEDYLVAQKAILVKDASENVVGMVTQWDVLRSLEPKYEKVGDLKTISRYGFSDHFIKSMIVDYDLWQEPLADLCRKASDIKVGTIMHDLREAERVDADASLNEAIHHLVISRHPTVFVVRNKEITGIIRLSDVFRIIVSTMKECGI